MIRPSELIFLLATLCSLAAYNLWQFAPEGFYFWEKMLSLALVGWLWSFHLTVSTKRMVMKCGVWVVMWWAVMNAWDEWVGDPTSKSWYEYSIATFGIYTGWLKYRNKNIVEVWRKNFRRLRNLY